MWKGLPIKGTKCFAPNDLFALNSKLAVKNSDSRGRVRDRLPHNPFNQQDLKIELHTGELRGTNRMPSN